MKLRTLVRIAQESDQGTPDFDQNEIEMGTKVEMEHKGTIEWLKKNCTTASMDEIARRIAQDHLRELPDYYTRLKKMESEG
jgi:hypothetical protein